MSVQYYFFDDIKCKTNNNYRFGFICEKPLQKGGQLAPRQADGKFFLYNHFFFQWWHLLCLPFNSFIPLSSSKVFVQLTLFFNWFHFLQSSYPPWTTSPLLYSVITYCTNYPSHFCDNHFCFFFMFLLFHRIVSQELKLFPCLVTSSPFFLSKLRILYYSMTDIISSHRLLCLYNRMLHWKRRVL